MRSSLERVHVCACRTTTERRAEMRVKGSGNALRAGSTASCRLTGRARRGERDAWTGARASGRAGWRRRPVGTRGRRCPKKSGIQRRSRVAVVSAPDGFEHDARPASRRRAGPAPGARPRRRHRVLRDPARRAGAALPGVRARARARRRPVGRVAEEDVGRRHRSRLRRGADIGLDAGLVDNKVCAIDDDVVGPAVRRTASPTVRGSERAGTRTRHVRSVRVGVVAAAARRSASA